MELKTFKEVLNKSDIINESENLKELKMLTKELKTIITTIEKEAIKSDKKNVSEADKLESSYIMMRKLKEICPITNEIDDLINMKW